MMDGPERKKCSHGDGDLVDLCRRATFHVFFMGDLTAVGTNTVPRGDTDRGQYLGWD